MQRFSTMSRLAAGGLAIVAAIALGAGAYAMWGDSGDSGAPAQDAATEQDGGGGVGLGMCAPGVTDCVDIIVDENGGDASGACLEGATDCIDNPADGDAARCAADGPDCMEPIFADPGCVDDGSGTVTCETPCSGDDTIELVDPPANGPAATDEEASLAEEERARAAGEDCAPAPCDPDAGGECLAPDCAVASDGTVTCPEPAEGNGGGTDAGGGSAPGAAGEAEPRTEPGVPEVDPAQ
ncbi:MAG TPA: hypothetical protein VNM91_07810 [Dehalococcoidia bacterium]|nr:hypothetical protein [Dehalococcoidia bacterium]